MGHIKEEAGSEPSGGFWQWMGPNQGLGGVSMGQDLDWGRGHIGSVGGVGAGWDFLSVPFLPRRSVLPAWSR